MIELSFGVLTVECPMIAEKIIDSLAKNLKSTNSRKTKDLTLTFNCVNQEHAGEQSIV